MIAADNGIANLIIGVRIAAVKSEYVFQLIGNFDGHFGSTCDDSDGLMTCIAEFFQRIADELI